MGSTGAKGCRPCDTAASPVIAVALLVAVAVVLSVSILYLGNGLGNRIDTEITHLVVETTDSPAEDEWSLRVRAAPATRPVSEFTFVISGEDVLCARDGPGVFAPPPPCDAYALEHIGGEELAVGDRLRVTKSDGPFTGTWSMEIAHRPSGTTAAQASRTF